ncbi:hypothetical protein Godav_015076, partial [Gossypium davidsonii]|nr:hypothetical protein [Gossypium davidsonii]
MTIRSWQLPKVGWAKVNVDGFVEVKFRHIQREANRVVDCIVKVDGGMMDQLVILEEPPRYVFQGTSWSVNEVVKVLYSWAKQYAFVCKANVAKGNGMNCYPGVIRDTRGNWILGFNKSLGIYFVLETELWGIFEGLSLLLKISKRWRITKEMFEVVALLTFGDDSGRAMKDFGS